MVKSKQEQVSELVSKGNQIQSGVSQIIQDGDVTLDTVVTLIQRVNEVVEEADEHIPEIAEAVGGAVYQVARETFLEELLGEKIELFEKIGKLLWQLSENEQVRSLAKATFLKIKEMCIDFINHVKKSVSEFVEKFVPEETERAEPVTRSQRISVC